MLERFRACACAVGAVAPALFLLWRGGGKGPDVAFAFGFAALVLLAAGRAPLWLTVLAALPFFHLLPGAPPAGLREAMAAASVVGPGTLAADPAAVFPGMLRLAGCLAAFALARTAAHASSTVAWWMTAGIAVFGCFQGAMGLAQGPGAAGALVNRGQYAALLELTFGAGCGLAAASWAGRTWRRRFEERALLGGVVGIAAAGLSLAGIVVSLSRAGIVAAGLAVGVGTVWLGRRKAGVAGVGAAVVLCGWLAAPRIADRALDRFETLARQGGDPGRAAVWKDTLRLAQETKLAGVGLGSFSSAFQRSSFYLPRKTIDHAHSDYLEWLVELGAPIAALLLGSAAVCVVAAARGASPLAAGCLLGVGAVLLHASVDLPLQSPGLAALASALLGLSARSRAPSARLVRDRLGAALLAALFLGVLTNLDETRTPRALYQAASQADASESERLYRAVLDRNLFAAPAWLRLAEIERSRGGYAQARLYLEAARAAEPFTLRTEWPLAEAELAAGDMRAGVGRLAGLVASAPDLLEAALHTAWRSGASPDDLERLVPRDDAEAAGRYLTFLVRNGLAEDIPAIYGRLGAPDLPPLYRDWLAREAGFHP